MPRTDDEVISELKAIYREEFAGKSTQRFLIAWADLRTLYGFTKLFESRFAQLAERAVERGLYLFDLGEGDGGHMVAVVKGRTVDRWRKVPRNIIRAHLPPAPSTECDTDEDADDE
jgi:hypothetical protein